MSTASCERCGGFVSVHWLGPPTSRKQVSFRLLSDVENEDVKAFLLNKEFELQKNLISIHKEVIGGGDKIQLVMNFEEKIPYQILSSDAQKGVQDEIEQCKVTNKSYIEKLKQISTTVSTRSQSKDSILPLVVLNGLIKTLNAYNTILTKKKKMEIGYLKSYERAIREMYEFNNSDKKSSQLELLISNIQDRNKTRIHIEQMKLYRPQLFKKKINSWIVYKEILEYQHKIYSSLKSEEAPDKRAFYEEKICLLQKKAQFVETFPLNPKKNKLLHVVTPHGGFPSYGQKILDQHYVKTQQLFVRIPSHVTVYWAAYSSDMILYDTQVARIKEDLLGRGGTMNFLTEASTENKIKVKNQNEQEVNKIREYYSLLVMYPPDTWCVNMGFFFDIKQTDLFTFHTVGGKKSWEPFTLSDMEEVRPVLEQKGINEGYVLALSDICELLPKNQNHTIVFMSCAQELQGWGSSKWKNADVQRNNLKEIDKTILKHQEEWAKNFHKYLITEGRKTLQKLHNFNPSFQHTHNSMTPQEGDTATYTRTSGRSKNTPEKLLTKNNCLCLEYDQTTKKCRVDPSLNQGEELDEPVKDTEIFLAKQDFLEPGIF